MSPPSSQPQRAHVGPVPFVVCDLDAAVDLLIAHDPEAPGRALLFWNAYNVALADADPHYAALGARAASVFCDGVPVLWAGRRLHPGITGWSRVYGPDVMAATLDRGRTLGLRHYLLGSTEATLAALQTAIERRWPGARVVGVESPPFRQWGNDELVLRDERIRNSGADLVWVGLGTPLQDHECVRLADSLPITALGVGAAFDFIAGTKRQAPAVLQRSGLEWAYRLGTEPRRLARRYAWGNPRFVRVTLRQWRDMRSHETET